MLAKPMAADIKWSLSPAGLVAVLGAVMLVHGFADLATSARILS